MCILQMKFAEIQPQACRQRQYYSHKFANAPMRKYNIYVGYLYIQFWQSKCRRRSIIAIWRHWGPSARNTYVVLIYTYIMQCGLNLSLFVDQPTISKISNDMVVSENDTATITCTVDSIPQSIIRWIFETKELQNKYNGSFTLNKIYCLSMGKYTCQAVNMLGGDSRYVDVTVACEYLFIYMTNNNVQYLWLYGSQNANKFNQYWE